MNKTLAITAIALVAVVMGFSAVVPIIPQAEASHADCAQGEGQDVVRIHPTPPISLPPPPCP